MNVQKNSHAMEHEFSSADAAVVGLLHSLQQEPSAALVAQVRAIPTERRGRGRWVPRPAWALVAAVLVVVAVVSLSPSLRARIAELDVTIGDITLSLADRSPDSSDAKIVEPQRMSLQEARAALPFEFGIPTGIPDGLVMDEQVRVSDLGGGPFVQIRWTDQGLAGISFTARQKRDGSSTLIGLESYREVEINGEPAVIVRGGWDADSRSWAWLDQITVIWAVDGVEYTLGASADHWTEADLSSIAESTR